MTATRKKADGYFTFVLHTHLPYVLGHGGWPHGTDWLHEAACETYIPLLRTFRALMAEGIAPKVTIGVSPVLAEQLADPAFAAGLGEYVEMKLRAAHDDGREFTRAGETHLAALAAGWRAFYESVWDEFIHYCDGSIVAGLRALQERGALEIITCAATHAYLPLVGREETIGLQLRAATAAHRRHFGAHPHGIWLPECAYRPGYDWRYPLEPWASRPARFRPGLEEHLARAGLDYFFVDTHLLTGGRALGVYAARFEALRRLYDQMLAGTPPPEAKDYSPHRPYYVGAADPAVACFVRDPETGLTVWSGEHGYPGDGWYLDFHKKHFPGGLRYWRVTSPRAGMGAKEPYEPARVGERVAENADHFAGLVRQLLRTAPHERPVLVAPYDTELFGHWWHEGPRWIGEVLRRLAAAPDVDLLTCGEYLARFPPESAVALPEGSWGEGGFHSIWLNAETEWSWRLIYEVEDELVAAAEKPKSAAGERLFRQALREFMLLVASDWQFLITTWSARDYAEERLRAHHRDLSLLLDIMRREAESGRITAQDRAYLTRLEQTDRPFKDVEPGWFASLVNAR